MFARFRNVRDRLNVSIVEAARAGARVRQRQIASLGSVPLAPSPADRLRCRTKVNQRLVNASNRVDDKTRWAEAAIAPCARAIAE
jgi:hypothetical protein